MTTNTLGILGDEILVFASEAYKSLALEVGSNRRDNTYGCWRFPLRDSYLFAVDSRFRQNVFTRSDGFDRELRAALARARVSESIRGSSQLAQPTVRKRDLWLHQLQGYHFVKDKRAGLFDMFMGCLSAETILHCTRSTRWFTITAEELHQRMSGERGSGRRWDLSIPTYIRGRKPDGRLGLVEAVASYDNGIKQCAKVTLSDGKTVTCTLDHELVTPTGKVQCQYLKQGDVVLAQTEKSKSGKLVDKDGYIRVRQADGSFEMEHRLIVGITDDRVVHHKNGVKTDNSLDNLEITSDVEHSLHHSRHRARTERGYFAPGSSRITNYRGYQESGWVQVPIGYPTVVSVEPVGARHVYDFTVDSPYHDYVANGVVVGNTGKTATTIATLENSNVKYVLVMCPLKVVSVWPGELEKWAALPYDVLPLDRGSTRQKRDRLDNFMRTSYHDTRMKYVVINYDAMRTEDVRLTLCAYHWDTVVLDECHPAGTMIATPNGPIAIERLRLGDDIYSRDNSGNIVVGQVTHTFNRITNEQILTIGQTRMTPEHPVWTRRGYVPARDVVAFDTLCYIRLDDQGTNPSTHLRTLQSTIYGRYKESPILLTKLQEYSDVADQTCVERRTSCTYERSAQQARCSREDKCTSCQREQSCQESNQQTQSCNRITRERVRSSKWGERTWTYRTTTSAGLATWMGNRSSNSYRIGLTISYALQDRHSRRGAQNWNRSRWAQPQSEVYTRKGREEDEIPGIARMDNSTIQEYRDTGGCRILRTNSTVVYNIETTVGNYFADGLLVHNSQKIKSPSGITSRNAAKIADSADRALALTGTPMPHSPLDIYGQFRALDSGIFGPSYTRFRNRYAIMGGFDDKQVLGYKNTREFYDKVHSITYSATKDVLDLPPEHDVIYTAEMNAEATRVYEEMRDDMIADIAGSEEPAIAKNTLVKLLRLQQVTGGWIEDHKLDTAKSTLFLELLDSLPRAEPVVVFCKFKSDMKAVHDACESAKRSHMELSGSRNELAQWQAGAADVLVVQIQAGGAGIDLTRAAYCFYYSTGYSLGDYEQSRARVHRPGQTRATTYIHLHSVLPAAKGGRQRVTIDHTIAKVLRERADIVRAIMAGEVL